MCEDSRGSTIAGRRRHAEAVCGPRPTRVSATTVGRPQQASYAMRVQDAGGRPADRLLYVWSVGARGNTSGGGDGRHVLRFCLMAHAVPHQARPVKSTMTEIPDVLTGGGEA